MEKNVIWILVPIGSHTNEMIARDLSGICRADETIQTKEGQGYIVPSDLFVDDDGKERPSVFLKKIESSQAQFNLKYKIFRKEGGGEPKEWPFSFINRGQGKTKATKTVNKIIDFNKRKKQSSKIRSLVRGKLR